MADGGQFAFEIQRGESSIIFLAGMYGHVEVVECEQFLWLVDQVKIFQVDHVLTFERLLYRSASCIAIEQRSRV